MEYKLHLAAPHGDIIPLYVVAIAMAMRGATAAGNHEPMFEGGLPGYILHLLEEVRSGRLKVCNTFGGPIEVDDNIDATEHFGYATRYVKEPNWEKLRTEIPQIGKGIWDFSHIDLGPMEMDKDKPQIFWFAKLKILNEWAEQRGDSFSISHEGVGWIDERGHVVVTANEGHVNQDGVSKPVSRAQHTDTWEVEARKIAISFATQYPNLNLEKIAEKTYQKMVTRKQDGHSGMTGRGGKVPSPGTIQRHALKGIKVRTSSRLLR